MSSNQDATVKNINMSSRTKLIGTWECLYFRAVNINDSNDITYPFTEDVKGNLVYSADGYMASFMQHPNAAEKEETNEAASENLKQQQGGHSIPSTSGYHGIWELEELESGKMKLVHTMLISLPAAWNGQSQVRMGTMWEDGGTQYMKLEPELDVSLSDGKVERRMEVGWRKRKPSKGAAL